MPSKMELEIYAQAEAWRSTLTTIRECQTDLARFLERARGREVRFLGAGSSYYLGLTAAASWGRRSWPARALPSSEQILHPDLYPSDPAPVAVAVSRSGSTTETLQALDVLAKRGSPNIGITTEPESPMHGHADFMIEVPGAKEESTVQTRSFSSQLIAAQAIGFLAAGDTEGLDALEQLPDLLDGWLETVDAEASDLAARFQRAYILGTGPRWSLAMEGALKLKETSLTEAEAFQTLEFRHGPQSMVDADTLVVGLVGERSRAAELTVLEEMRALGATVLAVGPGLSEVSDAFRSLSFESGLPPDAAAALYLPPLQLLACRKGLRNGLDPDRPRNLKFAIELERI